jgi:hypothetical protein
MPLTVTIERTQATCRMQAAYYTGAGGCMVGVKLTLGNDKVRVARVHAAKAGWLCERLGLRAYHKSKSLFATSVVSSGGSRGKGIHANQHARVVSVSDDLIVVLTHSSWVKSPGLAEIL